MIVEALDRAVGGEVDGAVADAEPWAAVARLPIKQRAVLVLRFYLDCSLEWIAEALEIPPGTVKSRLHRALEALESSEEVRR